MAREKETKREREKERDKKRAHPKPPVTLAGKLAG
jgi:hypothetical protein